VTIYIALKNIGPLFIAVIEKFQIDANNHFQSVSNLLVLKNLELD